MRGNVCKYDGYRAPELIFETRGDAADVLAEMKNTLRTYGCVTAADMLDIVGDDSMREELDENYGWTSLITAGVVKNRNGYIIDLPIPMLINWNGISTNNNTKKEKETMKRDPFTMTNICANTSVAYMTIGDETFPVKIKNVTCNSSNPFDSTTTLTVEIGGNYYIPYPLMSRNQTNKPEITRVIFNDPATIVFWSDGTKTVVKCDERDEFDHEKGLVMAIAKKSLGNNYEYYATIKRFLPSTYWEEAKEQKELRDCRACNYSDCSGNTWPCDPCISRAAAGEPHTYWTRKEY